MDKRLEERYIVIKLKYLNKIDPSKGIEGAIRKLGQGAMVDCVVVEEDWPEYKPTVDAIMTRVTKENLPPLPEGVMPWDDIDTYGPS